MEGTITMATLISSIGEIFTGAIGWVGTVSSTIAGDPLLLFGVLLGFVGLGIGLFKRLFRI